MSDEKPVPNDAPPAPEAAPVQPDPLQAEAFDKAQAEAFGMAQAELAALREKAAKADEYLELARRAKADFINYQDRVRRDRQDWTRQALEGFIRELLGALDGFSLARFEDPKLMEAIRLLEKEFLRILAKSGVTPIDTSGKGFDPAFHEAVAVEPGGEALEEVRRGWMIGDRVLRPSSVRIVKPRDAGADAPGK